MGELIESFVRIYDAESAFRNVIVYGGEDDLRKDFCLGFFNGIPGNLRVSDAGAEFDTEKKGLNYVINLGYFLDRDILPEAADTHYQPGDSREMGLLEILRFSVV